MTMALATSLSSGVSSEPGGPPSGSAASRRSLAGRVGPLAMLVPAAAVMAVMIGYPLVRLFTVSFQEYGRAQVFGQPAPFIGLDNYRAILHDSAFWDVLSRSLIFCAVNVVATMAVGTLVAVLLTRLHRHIRVLTSIGLLVAWAMPALTAMIIWGWMFDTQFGVVNYLITNLTPWDYTGHSWLIDPLSFFFVATVVIVWQSVPFVAFSVYAGLTQVPDDLLEAAELDGAGAWRRFRHIVFPYLRPIFLILTVLEIIWDLRVFTQIYALQGIGGLREKTSTLGVYIYQISVGTGDFGSGGAIAVLMVVVMLVIGFGYVRAAIRAEES
jgi:N,N'-diacetylchitobiose transport system permease protein